MSYVSKILIVDDDEGMRDTLSDIFEEEGYSVGCASTGNEALKYISEEFYNLALIDIKLPDVSGTELLEKVKRISADTAAILMTGYASMETSVEAVNLGAEAYIIKPLNIDEVKVSIRRALDKQRLVMENRRLVEELKASNDKLREEIREKEALQATLVQSEKLSGLGKLAAGASHEINNPLCVILGRTQFLGGMLEKSSCDRRIKEGLDVIEEEGKRIAGILENLDLYCRPSMHGFRMIDVNRTIEKTLSLVQAKSDVLNVKIETKFDASLPEVMADENGLMHVFMNLMRNARDAMPEGGTLEIFTSRPPENSSVSIVFQDTGEGIPRENIEHVFEPFFTTRDPGKGVGLGLSIAYQIVKEHGGDITVESEEGKGTTVTATLPANGEKRKSNLEKISRKEDRNEKNSRSRR